MEPGKDYARDPAIVKKMAALLMKGATMLQETCPLDGLPLFRLRTGEVVCPVHGRVVIVASEKEARDLEVEEILYDVMHKAALRLRSESEAGDPGRVREWLHIIRDVEDVLERRARRLGGTKENDKNSKK